MTALSSSDHALRFLKFLGTGSDLLARLGHINDEQVHPHALAKRSARA
jgi:hypothetical protein